MTRLGTLLWGTVATAASAGLVLSLAMLLRAPEAPGSRVEVRGPAAVQERASAPPTRTPAPGAERVRRSSAAVLTTPDAAPRPLLLRAAAIGLTAPVEAVGVGPDRQMQLPPDPRRVGWYRYGPAPGSGQGSAVLAGHVDSRAYGVGPLARLGELQPGDIVAVRLATGGWRRFRVDSLQSFERQALPDSLFVRGGPERLRLVTCTGAYLPDQGGYQKNLVVTAVPV